ncbi:MAG: BamA/TamA family outer membrane protein, partial [Gemmatimonas sp.]
QLGPVVYGIRGNADKVTIVERDGERFLEVKKDSVAPIEPDIIVPRGGTALVVGNLEWRRRISWPTDKLQLALFADAGTVFESRASSFDWQDVRVTPGIGFRLDTPLGPFRLDIGYNPYDAPSGRLLYIVTQTNEAAGYIQCASPGNTSPLDANDRAPLDVARCPSNYQPPKPTFWKRLVFHFSLGQAF